MNGCEEGVLESEREKGGEDERGDTGIPQI